MPAASGKELLMAVVGAVADGQPVDWTLAESTPLSDEERSLLAELKVLEGLHRLHRSGTPASSPGDSRGLDTNTMHFAEPPKGKAAANGDTSVLTAATASTPIPRAWGHLEIRRVLGAGGFGVVYQAWDPHLASDVALKVLISEKASAGATVIQEARLLARVRHPNIVSIYGAERSEGQVGLWMELVRGRTLKQLVKQQGIFGAREAALVGLDLTRALAAVHGAGLVHRDVKPHNVMRDDSGRIVLMDFGAGIELKELSDDPQRKYIGTPLYMAPELFGHHQPSTQTDLYSLGVLLYHLVTGAYPVEGPGADEVELQHVRGERKRLRDMRPDLPTEFVRIVERAIDPDASRRYGSAGAMEADLAHFVVQEDRAASPQAAAGSAAVVPPRRGGRWRRATIIAAALLILATAGISTLTFRSWRRAAAPVPPEWRSLVVLPFLNLSGDPADEYFADGMTDLLTADLSMIPGLKVISRTSAMSFKSSKKPLPEIARALNVGGVIEGSIARTGDRVQITLQVIEAGTDLHLWSNRYEGHIGDISMLDGEIVQRIAREIGAALTPELQQRLSAVRQVRPEALDEYLKGRYAANAYTEAGDREALAHFSKAAELDPKYPLAPVGLANAYRSLANRSSEPARSDYYELARNAALRARQLDDGLPGPYLALANIEMYAFWDWRAAASDFARALELNTNDPDAHQQYAWFLAARGDLGRALTHAQAARELDPLGLIRRTTAAGIMYYARMYPQAIKELKDVVDLNPSFVVAHVGLGRTYAASRMFDLAAEEINRAMELGGRQPALLAELGRIRADSNRPAEARRVLDELLAIAATGTRVGPGNFAVLYASLGDRDRALAELEEGVRHHLAELLWIKVDPSLDRLRNDPRFVSLLKLGGFTP
jgi:TolB-like protein/Tfp pilus assembly protein PilF